MQPVDLIYTQRSYVFIWWGAIDILHNKKNIFRWEIRKVLLLANIVLSWVSYKGLLTNY